MCCRSELSVSLTIFMMNGNSEDGHIKITDFGTAKDETEESRHNTFCGTAEFVSPEVLRDQEASRGCDLWAVGCMIFQMLVGRPMFRAENEYLTFQQILNHPAEDFAYPPGFPDVARDLIDKLLLQEPKERLGAGSEEDGNGYSSLKAHPFFDGIHWETLGSTRPPYIPHVNRLPATDNVSAHLLGFAAYIGHHTYSVDSLFFNSGWCNRGLAVCWRCDRVASVVWSGVRANGAVRSSVADDVDFVVNYVLTQSVVSQIVANVLARL